MHSSVLKGSDFRLSWKGRETSHGEFFRGHTRRVRVGLFAPDGTEGVGAVCLSMAYVTAFYDRYREQGGTFFAYPDFFTFQRREPPASYGSFDFWPNKDVAVPHDHNATAAAIADRAVNVLLVPDTAAAGDAAGREYEPVQLERVRRTLSRCFAYGPCGSVADPDLMIRCAAEPFLTYAMQVVRSANADVPKWLGCADALSTLQQSFRELEVDDALARL